MTKDEKRRLSYSQYSMWMNCRHQWKLNYVDGYKVEEDTIHTVFGTAIHETLQHWITKYYEKHEDFQVFDMDGFFFNKLSQLFRETVRIVNDQKVFVCDKPTLLEFYKDGIVILRYIRERYKEWLLRDGWELIGCEVPLDVDLTETLYFMGYLDVVMTHPESGKVLILDFKTSNKGWRYEKTDSKKLNQLLLYKHFFMTQFKVDARNIDVKFIILTRNPQEYGITTVEDFIPPNAPANIRNAVASFESFIYESFDSQGIPQPQNLKPSPSRNACRFCAFRNNKTLCAVGISE